MLFSGCQGLLICHCHSLVAIYHIAYCSLEVCYYEHCSFTSAVKFAANPVHLSNIFFQLLLDQTLLYFACRITAFDNTWAFFCIHDTQAGCLFFAELSWLHPLLKQFTASLPCDATAIFHFFLLVYFLFVLD